MTVLRQLSIILLAIALPCVAHAHKLSLFATATDTAVNGSVYYPTGAASGITVHLVDKDGTMIGERVSDEQCRFTFVPLPPLPFSLTAETADGHRAEFSFDVEDAAPNATDPAPVTPDADLDARIRGIVQVELQPLQMDLAERADHARVRDIVAGIGYIVGIFGVVALVRRRVKP